MNIIINGKEYNPEHFCERINIESALIVCQEAQEGKFESYWKIWRDAEVLLKTLLSQCHVCTNHATWLIDMNDDYYTLRCDAHKPFTNCERIR